MRKVFLFLSALVLLPAHGQTSYSHDTSEIEVVYASPSGAIALKLKDGFSNADATEQCPGNHGWAGLQSAEPSFVSVVLLAKASNMPITVTTQGCAPNGAWLNILDVYFE